MTYAAETLPKGVQRILRWQAGLSVAVGLVVVFGGAHRGGLEPFCSALAGGAVAMLGTLALALTIGRADVHRSPAQAQLWLYGGAAGRFVLALALLGLGLGVLGLSPLPFLAAFALGQMAFMVPGISSRL